MTVGPIMGTHLVEALLLCTRQGLLAVQCRERTAEGVGDHY